MARRRLKNPSKLSVLVFAAAAATAGGVYLWSSSAEAKKKKEKKKKLTSKKPPRTNQVERVTSWDAFKAETPDAPWLLLLYCDDEEGQAMLKEYEALGKTASKDVELFALSMKGMPEAEELCGGQLSGFMFGRRLQGSWLQQVSGEDVEDAAFMLADSEVNTLKLQRLLAWAGGEGDVPLERSIWIGDPESIWVEWDVQPPPINVGIGNFYEIPIVPPDPMSPVTVSNSDEVAVATDNFVSDEGVPPYIEPGTTMLMLYPAEPTVAAIVSVQQGDWKRQILVRVPPPLPVPVPDDAG